MIASISPATGSNPPLRRPSAKRRLHLELVSDVALITFDNPDKAINLIDHALLAELEAALRAVTRLEAKGVIFLSAKPSTFLAGADLESLGKLRGEALDAVVRQGQVVFSTLASLGVPTVAAIHGACLGGGLELALACDRRLASDDSATLLGLPETRLGLLPAWGGSTRLPRLIGLPKALDLILKGKRVSAQPAKRIGLVDEVVPKERLKARALDLLGESAPRRKSFFLTNNPLSAAVIRALTKRNLMKKTRGHYPAPLEALAVVGRGCRIASTNLDRSFDREREAFVRLSETPAARNLIRLFFLQEKAKHDHPNPEALGPSLAAVEHTSVIGAGVMGAGIAQCFASRGVPVILSDLDPARVAAGMKALARRFDEAVNRGLVSHHEAGRKLDLILPTADRVPMLRCDLVVEAVVEDLAVKKRLFADLCTRTLPETILATNTSALSVTEIAAAGGVTHPERVIGLHFFNPVSRMKLVEIIATDLTTPEVVERALAFVRSLGKTPVVVKDSPGFLVNRILMPYLIEAGRMAESGIPVGWIDEAMLAFGMPMGPLRLLDEIGLDVAMHVAATMGTAFGDRFAPPRLLADLACSGQLGRKGGRGFYRYDRGREVPVVFANRPLETPDKATLSERLNHRIVEESKRCLEEGIVRDADTINLALILGIGYAPFRGGPLAEDGSRAKIPSPFSQPTHQ